MTTLLDSTHIEKTSTYHYISSYDISNNNNYIRCKKSIRKFQDNKYLKNKLKKYKLRKDGKEDQDIVDVSLTFQKKLHFKNHSETDFGKKYFDHKPVNYLFKMGRKKKISKEIVSEITSPNSTKHKIVVNNEHVTVSNNIIKHTNAFQLMMESRNKTIGSNSPGKEKNCDEIDNEILLQNKDIKVKRNLLLQKMAESKGLLRNKEIEEVKEKNVENKMKARAERLKNMISNQKEKTKIKSTKEESKTKIKSKEADKDCIDKSPSSKNNNVKLLKSVDLFTNDNSLNKTNQNLNKMSEEDKEFLLKLSPSMKKKENMLSYFKKVEKFDICEPDDIPCNENTFKIKFTPRNKKKKKLSLQKKNNRKDDMKNENELFENANGINAIKDSNNESIINESFSTISEQIVENITCSEPKVLFPAKRKRKCKDYTESNNEDIEIFEEVKSERPKRLTKKPIKYVDDVELLSSDEDVYIFTPKKKKNIAKSENNMAAKSVNNNSNKKVLLKNEKLNIDDTKKSTKLAPIFASKIQLTPVEIEAKLKFLHSGAPEQIKKMTNICHKNSMLLNAFPVVCHVQQTNTMITNSPSIEFDLFENCLSDEELKHEETDFFKKLINFRTKNIKVFEKQSSPCEVGSTLKSLKSYFPKFPVFRTYHNLRAKKKGELQETSFIDNSTELVNDSFDTKAENPDCLNWTEKYKPSSSKQIIGNFESVKEIKKWLMNLSENDFRIANSKKHKPLDSSDEYQSETDSRDSSSFKYNNNLLVLKGPVGCGKTSCVYAIASELSIKVIEVNVSSKRTGKVMLQELQEATQSHKVNRGKTSSTESSQQSQEVVDFVLKTPKKQYTNKKKIKPVKNEILSQPCSLEISKTCMSLILIDDSDIVFDQDDGFCSAITQLVQYSKRPVILVTESLTCSHLQKFVPIAKIVTMKPLLPKLLGTWLDIMSLTDSSTCCPGTGSEVLDFFKGDIRKTINFMQFYNNNIYNKEDENKEDYKSVIDDENSSMSWTEREYASDKKNIKYSVDNSWRCCFQNQLNLENLSYPNMFNIWWSLPELIKSDDINIKSSTSSKTSTDLLEISKTLDSFSSLDCFNRKHDSHRNLASTPWYSTAKDYVLDEKVHDFYNNHREFIEDLSCELVKCSIKQAQKVMKCENNIDIGFPSMLLQRDKDRLLSRHHSLTNDLSIGSILDRKALSLDYWMSCRAICRIEKNRTGNNSKRNNRFCHYLKTLKVMLKNDKFDKLGESFCIDLDKSDE